MVSCVESMYVCVWEALGWSWGHDSSFAPLLLGVFCTFWLLGSALLYLVGDENSEPDADTFILVIIQSC